MLRARALFIDYFGGDVAAPHFHAAIAPIAAPDAVDIPGNTTTTQTLIVGGASATSTIDVSGDHDWFAVNLVAGESYQFSITGGTLSDTFLEVYGPGGVLDSVDDDGGVGTNSLMHYTATATGTYYLSAEGFDTETGTYTISASLGPPQDPLDTIDLGFKLTAATLGVVHVYFASAGQQFGPSGAAIRSWTAAEQAQVMDALSQISAAVNITFVQTTNSAVSDLTFTLDTLDAGVLGQTYPGASHGYLEFDPAEVGWTTAGLQAGGLGYSVILHEVGHALGLDHPFLDGQDNQVMQGVTSIFDDYGTFLLNQQVFTIMSYNDGWPTGPSGVSPSYNYGYAYSMMALDIAALQERYGANTSAASGDSNYLLSDSTVGDGAGYGAIWDTGGSDTISYTGTSDAVIDLRAATLQSEIGGGGYVSYVHGSFSGYTIANGVIIENATSGSGNDTLTGNDASNTLSSGAGNDSLFGGEGNDTLISAAGNDTIDGGIGADTMNGGPGSDIYTVDNAGDVVTELAGDSGIDFVYAFVDFVLPTGVEQASLEGAAHVATGNSLNNVIDAVNVVGATLSGLGGDDQLTGGGGDDVLIGGAGADRLDGGAGYDTADYSGSASAVTVGVFGDYHGGDAEGDTLVNVEKVIGSDFGDTFGDFTEVRAGAGNDAIYVASVFPGADVPGVIVDGGDGVDTAIYTTWGEGVVIDLTSGVGAAAETLISIENISGSGFSDTLMGGAEANLFKGNNGDDVLIGGAGADKLDGGNGSDTASYETASAAVHANLAASATNTGDAAGDTYISIENLTGSNFADLLTGDANVNTLSGNAGNDVMNGDDGNDTLDGGSGADKLTGGNGVDTASYATAAAGVTANLFDHTLNTGDAAGDVFSSIEVLIGSAFNDTLVGTSAANRFDGGAGADTMIGGAGNDVYIVDNVGDVVSETLSASGGVDTVKSSISYQLGANLENLTLLGSDNINGVGNTLANVITGNSGANALNGGGGDDTLNGGGGADTMKGGAGNDTFIVDNVGDKASEDSNNGVDLVQSSVTFQLGPNLENLTLTGTGAINGTGNTLANIITGNSSANILNGGNGDDTLLGGAGHDILKGGAGQDHFVFSSLDAADSDSISDFSHADDTIYLDNAVFTALGADGALASDAFWSSSDGVAHDADDRVIYNSVTGQLYYDADGDGAGAAVLIATLTAHPTLDATDFGII